ncbi:SCO family protein [Lederbergia citrea]|uniref:SCO family protein n=1 Tax=Lederbergia citrea TaxID=2833581 RepID=A0A942UNV7_9BACI|nr:SCO family protein [Lederbergia citrea]
MKVFAIALSLVAGFFAFYFLWPKSIELPKIGTVKEWPLEEVSGNQYNQKKPKLVTFFYTNCPDVCPLTMWDLKDLQKEMMKKGISDNRYLILSVTLDPEYDTIEKIKQYEKSFEITSPNWLFFRGSVAKTKKFTQYFKNMIYEKNEDGFLTHSTNMYVVDSNDQIRAYHNMSTGKKRANIEEIADQLGELVNKK